MKKVLFATTATAALLLGGMASAQGVNVFGSARLGLEYNDDDSDNNHGSEVTTTARIRFGANMSGETDSGITFGASMRVDNATNPLDGTESGQAGSAFISGAWGTVTMGDTSGADENWVGDAPGNLSLTGLGDENETPFFSNGGDFEDGDFIANPNARPTVRYDFDIAGFGFSLSSDQTLRDVGIGAGYSGTFGGFDLGIGLGYNDFAEFEIAGGTTNQTVNVDIDGDGTPEDVVIEVAEPATEISSGKQYSAGGTIGYENFSFGVTYSMAEADDHDAELETVHVGGTAGFGAFTVGAFYANFLTAKDANGDKLDADGEDGYGLTASYDLGGGATVNGGLVRTVGGNDRADFGVKMAF